jgi:hypothetical protein
MPRRRRRIPLTLLLLVLLDGGGTARAAVQTLHAPTPMTGDAFGAALDVAGDRLLVGAPGTRTAGLDDAGAAYVFDATTGVLRRTLQAPLPSAAAGFGGTVALVGPYAVVGAAAAPGVPGGAFYLFDAATGAFVLQLEADGSGPKGPALAAAGAMLVVGTERALGASGTAALFFLNGTIFRSLVPPVTAAGARFGSSVASIDTRVVVGAPGTRQGGLAGAGAAYVFEAASGVPLLSLASPDPTVGGAFGTRATTLGTDVVVSAPGDAPGTLGGGAAYSFDAVSGVLRQVYVPTLAVEASGFGQALAAIGGNVVVGAPGYPLVGLRDAGFAYLFDGAGGGVIRTYQSPAPIEDGRFGTAVAVSGGDVLIGESGALAGDATLPSPLVLPGAPGAGAVHRFTAEAVPGGGGITPVAPVVGVPTLPFGCVPVPVVTSLQCRVGGLARMVEARRGGRTKIALLRALRRAEAALAAAGDAGLPGRRRRALVVRARRSLTDFTARLDSRAGVRFLPPRAQPAIFAVVTPLLDDLAMLGATP